MHQMLACTDGAFHCSVATTSTKQPAVIKTDIRRVLDRMQIQYRETKTGFECVHLPSIDMSSVLPPPTPQLASSGSTGPGLSHKRSIVKKASKLSFGMKRDKGKDKELPLEKEKEKEKEAPGRPSVGTTLTTTPSSGSSSFFNVSSNNHTVVHGDHSANGANGPSADGPETPGSRPSTIGKGKMLPPIPRDSTSNRAPSPLHSLSQAPTGEVDAFDNVGNNKLGVRFEINIVKVSCC